MDRMHPVPVTVCLREAHILIVGGGRIGTQKYHNLKQMTDRIRVIAEETELTGPDIVRRAFREEDIKEAALVIAATADPEQNAAIAALCKKRQIPVNVVSDAALSDFQLPAVIKRGDLLLTLSTGGASPAYAKVLRTQIEAMLPEHIEEVLEQMQAVRETYRKRIALQEDRARFYRAVLSYLLANDPPFSEEPIAAIAEEYV